MATTEHIITLKFVLKPEFLGDILVTAFDGNYGGSWYWAAPAEEEWLEVQHSDDDQVWMQVKIVDKEDDLDFDRDEEHTVYTVTHESLAKAIQKILLTECISTDLMEQISRSVREGSADIDASAADCIVQMAVLGGITYG